jgi:hypothetical protein
MGCRDKDYEGSLSSASDDGNRPPVIVPKPVIVEPVVVEPPEPVIVEPVVVPDPVHELSVEIDNKYGDRFKPVSVRVEYTIDGVGAKYEFKVPYGDVEESHDGFLIYGDGQRHEDLVFTVNGEEYLYQLRREPRCGKVDMVTDCTGYTYRGTERGYIYYGEEDQDIVYWGLAYTAYDNTLQPYEWVEEPDGPVVDEALHMIRLANEIYEAAGVYVRLYLEKAIRARYMNNQGHTSVAKDAAPTADIAIGRGVTCEGAGGCAQVYVTFREGSGNLPAGTMQRQDIYVFLHELGHMVGLAHGLDNYANPAQGYIWPQFGQGYSTPFCGNTTDLMSYHPNGVTHNNSLITCPDGEPAGSREISDTAYHLNRVRYDVSLIGKEPDAPPAFMDEPPETGPLVID